MTPEEVKKAAEAAETNLNRRQERDDIIKILEGDGIKPTNFAKDAEDAAKMVLVADNYKPDRQWVTPEPGAGLLRDTPEAHRPHRALRLSRTRRRPGVRPGRERQQEAGNGEEGGPQAAIPNQTAAASSRRHGA